MICNLLLQFYALSSFSWWCLFFFLREIIFIHLFLAVLGLHCFAWAFSSCSGWGLLSSCGVWASHVGSVQFGCSVVSDSLWPQGLQHARPPCPSPAPGVYSNSGPLSRRSPPTILSSVIPFSSCLQSFPASGSFQMNQFFVSGGQSIGASASASVLSMNIQDWFPLGWTGWISL